MSLFGLFKKAKKLIRVFDIKCDSKAYSEMNNEEKFNCSKRLYESGKDLELSFELLLESADGGFADAQYQLAHFLIEGKEVEQDYVAAIFYLEKAAEQGHSRAMFDLGYLYQNGYGCSLDYKKAFSWYKKSAELGFADAIHQVGAYYWEGIGVEKDEDKAIKWFEKACKLNFVPSLIFLGNLYYNEENDEESYNLLKKASELGSEEASGLLTDEVYDRFR